MCLILLSLKNLCVCGLWKRRGRIFPPAGSGGGGLGTSFYFHRDALRSRELRGGTGFHKGKIAFYLEVRKRAKDAIPSTSFGTSLGSCHPHSHPALEGLCCTNWYWQGSWCWKLGKDNPCTPLQQWKNVLGVVSIPTWGSAAEPGSWKSRELKLVRVPLGLCIFISINLECKRLSRGDLSPGKQEAKPEMGSMEPSAPSEVLGKGIWETFKKLFQSFYTTIFVQAPQESTEVSKHFNRQWWGPAVARIWPLNVHPQRMEMFKNEQMWHLTLKVFSNLNDSMIPWDGSLRKRQNLYILLQFAAVIANTSVLHKYILTKPLFKPLGTFLLYFFS